MAIRARKTRILLDSTRPGIAFSPFPPLGRGTGLRSRNPGAFRRRLRAPLLFPYSVPMLTAQGGPVHRPFRVWQTLLALIVAAAISAVTSCTQRIDFDTARIEQELNDLLELHTYEHIYRDVVYFGEETRFLGIRTGENRVLFSIDIEVRAGVDLGSGFSVRQDRAVPERLYVQLPEAQILSVDADESSIHEYFIYDRRSEIGLLDLTSQLGEVKSRIEADAIERGILDKAQANANRIVEEFLTVAGFTEIEFAPPARTEIEEIEG